MQDEKPYFSDERKRSGVVDPATEEGWDTSDVDDMDGSYEYPAPSSKQPAESTLPRESLTYIPDFASSTITWPTPPHVDFQRTLTHAHPFIRMLLPRPADAMKELDAATFTHTQSVLAWHVGPSRPHGIGAAIRVNAATCDKVVEWLLLHKHVIGRIDIIWEEE